MPSWGGDRIAYQVVGQGPPDLVMTTASFGDIDVAWEDPGLALFYRTLASFSRLIPERFTHCHARSLGFAAKSQGRTREAIGEAGGRRPRS